jgi:hypothetical protein
MRTAFMFMSFISCTSARLSARLVVRPESGHAECRFTPLRTTRVPFT